MSCQSWNDVLKCTDPVLAFEMFYNLFTNIFNQCFPQVQSKRKDMPCNGWWNKNLAELRNKLLKMEPLKYSSCPLDKRNYKLFKQSYVKAIKEAKVEYQLKRINSSKNKTKALWSLFKEKTNKDIANLELNVNNVFITNPQDIVNVFLNEFTPTLAHNVELCDPFKSVNLNSLYFVPVTSDEVKSEVKNLGSSKCSGYDGIPIPMLQCVADFIAEPFSHCANLCFQIGYFPKELKHSIIKPLFKKGDKRDPSNYRGIYIMSNVGKLMEKLMKSRLESFFNENNILSSHQHGYTVGKSTTSATTEFLHSIHTKLSNGNNVLALFIDFSKAFDSCHHNLLLSKLEAYGVRGPCLQLCKSYLNGRTQSVDQCFSKFDDDEIKKHHVVSESKAVNCGVFAGTICGPLLFNVFLNSLFKCLGDEGEISVTAYADDLVIVLGAVDTEFLFQKSNEVMNKLNLWSNKNGLKLNTKKTNYMVIYSKPIRTKTDPFQLYLNHVILDEVPAFKYLGISITNSLDWSLHVCDIVKRLNKFVFLFRQLRQSFNTEQLLVFYRANCESLLRMGLCFWGQSSNINKVLIVQKRLLRTILFLNPKVSCREYFLKHKVKTIFNLIILEVGKYVHKNLGSVFNKNCYFHDHNTRRKDNLQVSLKMKFNKYYIKIFNKLPVSLRESSSFKKELNNILLSKNYYSLNEFFSDNLI